jgi:hypothetical protein
MPPKNFGGLKKKNRLRRKGLEKAAANAALCIMCRKRGSAAALAGYFC